MEGTTGRPGRIMGHRRPPVKWKKTRITITYYRGKRETGNTLDIDVISDGLFAIGKYPVQRGARETYNVTHLPTMGRPGPATFRTKKGALAFVAEIRTMADWSKVTTTNLRAMFPNGGDAIRDAWKRHGGIET